MKFYIIFISLVLPFLSFSQSYQKTVKDGKQWTITEPIGMGAVAQDHYIASCDTVINAKQYYQIHEVFNSGANFSPLLGFVREDTLAQKVYFLDTNTLNEELIADYTLTVGDSFNVTWSTPSFKLPVVHVDTIYINQALRKVIHFHGYGQGGPYLRFIEGVGNGFWGIYRNHNSFGNYEAVSVVNENTGISCGNVLPYETIENQTATVRIFPNPFKQGVSIKLEHLSSSLMNNEIGIIYNSLGQKIQSFEIFNRKELSLEHLAAGIYFIQIGNSPSIKIIKEH